LLVTEGIVIADWGFSGEEGRTGSHLEGMGTVVNIVGQGENTQVVGV